MKRIIIAGGRDFNDYQLAEREFILCTDNLQSHQVQIVSGGAKGADTIGEALHVKYNTNLAVFPAQWEVLGGVPCVIGYRNGKAYNKLAGINRNKLMAQNADMLLAFWDGKSKGTKNMIDEAKKLKLEIKIVGY